MTAAIVKYFVPKTLEEACSLLSAHKDEARVISGGTDILPQIRRGHLSPACLVNIAGIPGQDYIIYDEASGLRIGAQATMHSIASSTLIRDKFAILASAASQLGTPQIRNRATIGGNLCNASPSAETVPSLMVLGANLKVVRAGGGRHIPVESFAIGPGQTVLRSNEIVTEVRIPPPAPRSAGTYLAQGVRKVADMATVSVAALVTMDGDTMRDVKIALGAVACNAIRASVAETTLKGKRLSDDLLLKAAQTAAGECQPIDDVRGSAEYRRKIVAVLVARAVRQSVEQAKAD